MIDKRIEKVVIYYSDGTTQQIKNWDKPYTLSPNSCHKCGKSHGSLPCQYWDSFFQSNRD